MENKYPERKPTRVKNYDYSSVGAYFITICTKDRRNFFWNKQALNCRGDLWSSLRDDVLSDYGVIVTNEIKKIAEVYGGTVETANFVVMPNHIHLLLVLYNDMPDESGRPKVAPTTSRIVQQFKGAVTKKLGFSPWQKLYNDHIIRNYRDFLQHWQYIDENPIRWLNDKYYSTM